MDDMSGHIDYPHNPGYMLGCPLCEVSPCVEDGSADCTCVSHDHIILNLAGVTRSGIEELNETELDTEEGIPDSVILEVACRWQSPGSIGSAFASLASGCDTQLGDIIRDVRATRRHEGAYSHYEMLIAMNWCENQERRLEGR